MLRNGLFAKEVTIRLAADGTGFLYTAKHRWFGLQTGQIRLFEENEIPGGTAPHASVTKETAAQFLDKRS
jgi:hypothetical protein